jgi:RNA-directed DNA polymerase
VLNLHHPCQLATLLDTPLAYLQRVLSQAEDSYEHLVLLDPRKPGKRREVINPRGKLRGLQRRFYDRVLLPNLDRSHYSHGGVPGRNILTNVRPHLEQAFLFTVDICNFYPSVHWHRVFDLFLRLGCSPRVAHLCTRLCTYRHRLAQGLTTSPILADCLLRPVDDRVANACRSTNPPLVYTRFVDDITISGSFDLGRSGLPVLVRRVLSENGFAVNVDKYQFGRVADGATVTNIRFPNGHPDVQRAYCDEVARQLEDAASLGRGGPFDGPYYTEAQIWGRVRFICWVNPRRRRVLMGKLGRVDWRQVRVEAQSRGLEVVSKKLVRQSELD